MTAEQGTTINRHGATSPKRKRGLRAATTSPKRERGPCSAGTSPKRKRGPLLFVGTMLLALSAATILQPHRAFGAAPIPADRRIQATIVGTLSAPSDQPMHMPTDVAIDAAGRVFVADGANHRVLRFEADGRFAGAITEAAGKPLQRPVGLATHTDGALWIADSGNGRVVVQRSGVPDVEITLAPPDRGRAVEPTDVAITDDGRRAYIVDNDNHRVLIRDNQSGEVRPMGRFGEGLGQFRWPFMVAIAPGGYVHISEAIGSRVQRLSPRDQWAGQTGRWGVELGQLYRPKGITLDAEGRLYVGDSTLQVVQVFGPRGALEGVLTDVAGQLLRFKHPMGMTLDARGRLLVVELGADRVAIVNLPTTTASTRPAPATRPGGAP